MRKILLVIICSAFFLFLNNNLRAQSNFQEGYIISLKGETVNGFIDYQKWKKNPNTVSFKSDLTANSTTYKPDEIKSFYVKDELSFYMKDVKYVGVIMDIDKSPYKMGELTYDAVAELVTDTVFLSVLVEGEMSLYFLKDETSKPHFFIKNSEKEIEELIFGQYLSDIKKADGTKSTRAVKNEKYKGLLTVYMQDNTGFTKKIKDLTYHREPLKKLIQDYNKVKESDSRLYFETASRKSLRFIPTVVGGAYYNSIKIKEEDFGKAIGFSSRSFSTNSDMNPSYASYIFGLGLNMVSGRRLQRISWYQEFLFYSEKIDFEYNLERIGFYTKDCVHDMNLYYGKYNTMIRYKHGYKDFKPFINVGISASILLSHKGEITYTETKSFNLE
jgi:hypothetical protein